MDIPSLAVRYLRIKKRRTVLTAVGVALAVALVTGTGLLIASFIHMRIEKTIAENGSWHYQVSGIKTMQLAEQLKSNILFKKAGIAADDTVLKVSEKDKKSKTIPLYEYDAAALSMMPDVIVEGRAPKNNGEIVLSASAKPLFPGIRLGSSILLPCGTLASDQVSGSSDNSHAKTVFPADNDETFTQKSSRTFTVVGFSRRGIYDYQDIEFAVTLDPTGDHTYSVYAKIKPMLNFPASIRKAAADCGIKKASIHENGLVEWMGKSASTKVKTAVVTTFFILAAIILSITMLVIRNSFAMSVADKISEIGVLRCLGAAPGHIRSLVLSEALCIFGAAAPAGLLLGTGAMAVVIAVVRPIDPDDLRYLTLTPAAWPYIAALALSFFTVLLSSFGPVRTAMRVPMVEAVRGNAVLSNGGTSVKKGRRSRKWHILGGMFGFPGMLAAKNIRRSPKRFRTTVLSVTASVVLFLTVGGFALSVGSSLKTAFRQSGKMDFEFSAQSEIKDCVHGLDEVERKVKDINGIAAVQRTPLFALNADVPLKRVPSDYLKTYRDFMGHSRPESQPGSVRYHLLAMEVSRENYGSLPFLGKAPSYDELQKSGGALLCENSAIFSSGGRFANVPFADYRPGETLPLTEDQDGKSDGVKNTFAVKIAGLLSEFPWFSQSADGVLVFPEGGTALFNTAALKESASKDYTGNSGIFLEIRYAKGAEDQADAQVRSLMSTAQKSGVGFADNYRDNASQKSSYLIMLIFVGGFAVVVILISCINLFNTINANLQSRKREIGMTRAIGMDRSQLYRMLLLECSLYGSIGTAWGAVIGLTLQVLLLKASHMVIAANMVSPILLTLIALAATSGIGILAGISSIRRIAKAPIVDEIRAQE